MIVASSRARTTASALPDVDPRHDPPKNQSHSRLKDDAAVVRPGLVKLSRPPESEGPSAGIEPKPQARGIASAAAGFKSRSGAGSPSSRLLS